MNTHWFHTLTFLPLLFLYVAVQSSPINVHTIKFPRTLHRRHLNPEDEESSGRTGMLELQKVGVGFKSKSHSRFNSNSNPNSTKSFQLKNPVEKRDKITNEGEGTVTVTAYPPVSLPMRIKGVRLIVKNGTKYGIRNSASIRRGVGVGVGVGVSNKWKPEPTPTSPGLQITEILPPRIPILGLHKPKLASVEVYKPRTTISTTTTTTSTPEKVKMKVYIRNNGPESSQSPSTSASASPSPPELKRSKKKRRKKNFQQLVTNPPTPTTIPDVDQDQDHERLELLCVTPSGAGHKQRLSSTLVRRSWNCSGTRAEMPSGRKNMNSVMIPKTEIPQTQIPKYDWTNYEPKHSALEDNKQPEKLIPVFYIPELQPSPSPLPVIYSPIPVLPFIQQEPKLNNPQPWIPLTTEATSPENNINGKPDPNIWTSLKGTNWESDSESESLFIPGAPPHGPGRRLRRRRPSLARRMKWHLRRLGSIITGRGRGRRKH